MWFITHAFLGLGIAALCLALWCAWEAWLAR